MLYFCFNFVYSQKKLEAGGSVRGQPQFPFSPFFFEPILPHAFELILSLCRVLSILLSLEIHNHQDSILKIKQKNEKSNRGLHTNTYNFLFIFSIFYFFQFFYYNFLVYYSIFIFSFIFIFIQKKTYCTHRPPQRGCFFQTTFSQKLAQIAGKF